jgi:hypothetical protein
MQCMAYATKFPTTSSIYDTMHDRLLIIALLYITITNILIEHFQTQGHPAYCGLGSLTMALNSLLIDPKRTWQGVWRCLTLHYAYNTQ